MLQKKRPGDQYALPDYFRKVVVAEGDQEMRQVTQEFFVALESLRNVHLTHDAQSVLVGREPPQAGWGRSLGGLLRVALPPRFASGDRGQLRE